MVPYRLLLLLKGWRCLDVFNTHPDIVKYTPFTLPLGEEANFILNILTFHPNIGVEINFDLQNIRIRLDSINIAN